MRKPYIRLSTKAQRRKRAPAPAGNMRPHTPNTSAKFDSSLPRYRIRPDAEFSKRRRRQKLRPKSRVHYTILFVCIFPFCPIVFEHKHIFYLAFVPQFVGNCPARITPSEIAIYENRRIGCPNIQKFSELGIKLFFGKIYRVFDMPLLEILRLARIDDDEIFRQTVYLRKRNLVRV